MTDKIWVETDIPVEMYDDVLVREAYLEHRCSEVAQQIASQRNRLVEAEKVRVTVFYREIGGAYLPCEKKNAEHATVRIWYSTTARPASPGLVSDDTDPLGSVS